MSQKIHYQDDLFILSVLVKALDATLSVEADSEFFHSRIIEDVSFLDKGIRTFHEMLSQNSHLLERIEYLKLLDRTANAFIDCLGKLETGHYSTQTRQFHDIRAIHASLQAERAQILCSTYKDGAEIDLVSSDEISELLKG